MDVLILSNLGWVALGGFGGAILRYVICKYCNQSNGFQFPWGTLIVNCLACFLLGLMIFLFTSQFEIQLLICTGFLGSLSTFSTLMLDHNKLRRKNKMTSLLYLASSIGLGLIFFEIGTYLSGNVLF